MAKNSNLNAAKAEKNDEFYTRYEDIEKELVNYEDQLRGKVVYCNCDDVRYSNFLEYMCRAAPRIGIRKVIGSHYNPDGNESYYVTFVPPSNPEGWNSDTWENHLIEMPMEGNGDFRSEASIRLLQQADVVITNPPFSLFREYITQLINFNKKFLIIGNINAIAYREVFPYIKENKVWIGYSFNKTYIFKTPYANTLETNAKYVRSKGYNPEDGYIKVSGIAWFTNLNTSARVKPQELFLSYEKHDRPYEKFDNYNAINIDKYIEIPYDYYGVMGVPITWLDKYCPQQFKIIGIMTGITGYPYINGNDGRHKFYIGGEGVYNRILIRRRR